ncbi:MAG: energy-coupling factor transporter transmembrane protein EcfT [Bacillota bacterium]
MELTRNITLGIYLPGDTVIHRLDPRTKIIAGAILLCLLFLIKTYTAYAVFAAFTLALILTTRIPLKFTLNGLKPMLPVLAIMWLFQLFLQKPPGANVIFSFRFLEATDAGLHMGTLMAIRVILLLLITTTLTLTTSMVALTDGMEALLRPFRKIGVPSQELAMTMVIALRFVPTLAEEMEKIIKAQSARGVAFDRGNFILRTAKVFPVFLPLFINAFKRAEELIVAMEARSYTGGAGRTKMNGLRMNRLDAAAFAALLLFSAVMLILILSVLPSL